MYSTIQNSRLLNFMNEQIELWQHNKSFVSTTMFVAHLHARLLKVLSLNLKLIAQFSISKRRHLEDLKNAALLKVLKLSGYQSLKAVRKVIGNVLRH